MVKESINKYSSYFRRNRLKWVTKGNITVDGITGSSNDAGCFVGSKVIKIKVSFKTSSGFCSVNERHK